MLGNVSCWVAGVAGVGSLHFSTAFSGADMMPPNYFAKMCLTGVLLVLGAVTVVVAGLILVAKELFF